LSDEQGEFSKLTVDGMLESVLPSMARAITNRYGKFFAATVLNQAKDKLTNSSVAEVPVRVIGKRNTREIAEFAQEQGYDGVIFKNLTDNGGRNVMVSRKTVADIFVTFTPETIKSADTVTYGDDGKVIPLSERFSNDEDIRYSEKFDDKGEKYWQVEDSKDIFKGLSTNAEIEKAAFDYIIGRRDKNSVVETIDGKSIKFIRLSAEEFTKSKESKRLKALNNGSFNKKMRMIPSLDDLISHANVSWASPDLKNHKLFKEKGFDNYRGRVGIDNVIFNYIVRVGKTSFGDVFYDINLEVDQILPHTKSASEIKKSTSVNSLSQIPENVNSKFSEKIGKAEYEKVIKSLEKDNAALREDVKDLKELVKVQGKVTHGEVFTKTSVEAVAKKLARDFGMRGEKTELVKMLNEYYSSIASSASDNNLNFTDVMENALPIAQYIKRR
jgi:hypothetical protein